MAINQASLFFYPPRYGPSLVQEQAGNGQSIRLVDSQLVNDSGRTIVAGDVFAFFHRRGFVEVERWGNGITLALQADSTLGRQTQEIVVRIPENAAEDISHLYVRFLITKSAADKLDFWEELALALGRQFDMQLMAEDLTLVPCEHLKKVMMQNRAYCLITNSRNEGQP